MIWQKAMKYPVLIVGIILFVLYLTDDKTAVFWEKYQRRFIPSTCDAIKDRSEKKADSSWEFNCPGTQLLIIKIPYNENVGDKFPNTRQKMYKTLANSLVRLSQITNHETLEKLQNIKISVKSERLTILAKTDGLAVVQFKQKKTSAEIAKHLKLTVKTKEFR